jgi:hypothetical protein
MKLKKLILLLTLIASPSAFSHECPKPLPMPKSFAALQTLVGTWEGTTVEDGKEQPVTVVYRLTSGGTALEETLMPGTPKEMVSLYYRQGKSLGMTHYCALGNQPHMELISATDKVLTFEMKKPIGISSMKEMHMHSITLTLADADTLKQEWTNYSNGKKAETAVFTYKRKK